MLSQELEFCLNDAFAGAREARHEFMTVEHLLLAIVDTPKVREVLKSCGADTAKLKRPPLYQVVLINDDYTPMEFVVEILQRFFAMDRTKATRVMLEVHTKGKGVCGVFTYEIAETKVAQVIAYARQHQHPLMATLEEA